MMTPTLLGGIGRSFGIPEGKVRDSMEGLSGMFMNELAGRADDHATMEQTSRLINESPDEVDDVDGAASVVVEAATEVEVLVVEVGVSDFLELLHPETAASAATASTTGPRTDGRRCTNGGYVHAPP